jgi:hypothetical protein
MSCMFKAGVRKNQPFLLVFLCQEAGVFVFFLLLGVEESSMDLG